MCIAILNPNDKTLTEQTLRNCWENNGDGAGILYNDSGRLKIYKQMKNFGLFYKKYMRIRKNHPDSFLVLHFRISTHGIVNEANCHPFLVHQNLGFVHNGQMFNVEEDVTDRYSDTNMFNRTILKQFPKGIMTIDFLKTQAMDKLIHDFITTKNKLVFMDNENNYTIFSEDQGIWDDGVWYSNSSYERVKNYVDYGGTKVYKSQLGYGRNSWSWKDDYDYKYSGSGFGTASQPSVEEPTENSKIYKYASYHDWRCTNEDCTRYVQTGDLVSADGQCLCCMSNDEAAMILEAAWDDSVDNGPEQRELNEEVIATFSEPKKKKTCTCDYCTDVVEEVHSVSEWNAEICIKCVKEFVDHDYLKIIDRDVQAKLDALENEPKLNTFFFNEEEE
jgi:glutamine amidotransferase